MTLCLDKIRFEISFAWQLIKLFTARNGNPPDKALGVSTTKLGCHIHQQPKQTYLNMHIETKIKKAMSVLWMVKRNVSPKTSMKTKLCLYKSLILPIITFGSTCWWASMKNSRLLENFQRQVTKWITKTFQGLQEPPSKPTKSLTPANVFADTRSSYALQNYNVFF